MFERFTERARQCVVLAQEEARNLNHCHIGTEHVLLGVIAEHEGLGARVLDALGVTLDKTRARVAELAGRGTEGMTGQIPFTPRAKKVYELALREALSLGHNYIGTEHIVLGLVRENEGFGAQILLGFDADSEKVRNEVLRVLVGGNYERWAEYEVCKKRGHEASDRVIVTVPPKQTCKHCGTTYWTETVVRESGAPLPPRGKGNA